MGMHPRITDVIVDCVEPERVAAFWAELLGRPVGARIGPYVFLVRGDGPGLGFQRAGTAKAGKNRVHVDISAADPEATARRVEELGGRRLEEYAGGGFLVLADPEGDEFCVLPEGEVGLDAEGRAHYLRGE
jgi:predicted enzyme related to lactoylglutathione lyase